MSQPRSRRVHRLLGLLLVLPMTGWCVTGLLFHLKPGWTGAYDLPSLRFEPLGETAAPVQPEPGWLEVRRLRTALGEHLLVRTAEGRLHLDPATGRERPEPGEQELRRLLEEALGGKERYGGIASADGLEAVTTTGVELELDWQRLSLSQRGADTERIDWLYRVHYLQWTGVKAIDRVLAAAGLVALALLTLLGIRLAIGSRHE